MKKVFVSKALDQDHPVQRWAREQHVALHSEALISKQLLPSIGRPPKADWVFFSSPFAAKLFAAHFREELNHYKVAAIGRGSAHYLEDHALVHFEGAAPSTERVAKAFEAYTEGETILFPQSQISKRSVQQFIPAERVVDWLFYETKGAGKAIDADIYFFTSPSNVAAFATHNEVDSQGIYLAIGDSTAAAMLAAGLPVHGGPKSWLAEDWVEILKEKLSA